LPGRRQDRQTRAGQGGLKVKHNAQGIEKKCLCGFDFSPGNSVCEKSARSISPNCFSFPERGGHSISKVFDEFE
jgi:hypothetical protein